MFSNERFGEARADAYLLALEERFRLIANQPFLGKRIDHIREGYLRNGYANHAIYYTFREEGILIVRVLHNSMDVELHL